MRALAVFLFACLVGCSSSSSGTTSSSSSSSSSSSGSPGDGGGGPTFTQVYTTVIKPSCTPCHAQNIGVTEGKLDMSAQDKAYTNLVNTPAAGGGCNGKGTRVVPNKPDQSLLYLKIKAAPPCGEQMPLGLPALQKDATDLVSAWITAGAQNN